jgi:hypothetical protein
MDQRIAIGTSPTVGRPIHRAWVVPGCWCGANAARSTTADQPIIRSNAGGPAATSSLTTIALRSVGLPVV